MPAQQYTDCRTSANGAAFAVGDLPDLDAWMPYLLETARRASYQTHLTHAKSGMRTRPS